MITNDKLLKVAQVADFIRLGFVEKNDGSESAWGTWWEYLNEKFCITIDPTFVVELTRLNPDTDPITINVESLSDLEVLIDWIAD